MASYPAKKTSLRDYRLLSPLCSTRVSPLCLGAMNFGKGWEALMGECTFETATSIFDTYVNQGGNFIDTAVNYQNGDSEAWLGQMLQKRNQEGLRDDLVLATKFTSPSRIGSGGIDINRGGNSRKNLLYSVETSLKRLGTHYLDILYVHWFDYTTSPKEMMRALDDVIRSGKVSYSMISDTPAWVVSQCNTMADAYGWSPFVGYQGRYHLGDRAMEQDVIPMCLSLGLGVVPWGTLGQGKYTGKYKRGGPKPTDASRASVVMSDRDYNIAEAVSEIASLHGCTSGQVCVAWELSRPGVTSPLIGCRTLEQLKDNLGGLNVELTEEDLKKLEGVTAEPLIFPHNFLGTTGREKNPWLNHALIGRAGKIQGRL